MRKPIMTSVTLGVRSLSTSLRFYTDALGFIPSAFTGVDHDIGDARFFFLDTIRLGLWPVTSMQADTGVDFKEGRSSAVYGLSMESRASVDSAAKRVTLNGGAVLAGPRLNFWGGYSAYISDPDGHLWEVIYDPGILSGD